MHRRVIQPLPARHRLRLAGVWVHPGGLEGVVQMQQGCALLDSRPVNVHPVALVLFQCALEAAQRDPRHRFVQHDGHPGLKVHRVRGIAADGGNATLVTAVDVSVSCIDAGVLTAIIPVLLGNKRKNAMDAHTSAPGGAVWCDGPFVRD